MSASVSVEVETPRSMVMTTPSARRPTAVVVGEVAYQGVDVVVVREADETLLAYDPQVDCALVVSVEP